MSQDTNNASGDVVSTAEAKSPNPQREALLNQCDLMGIPYQSNTATKVLIELIQAKQAENNQTVLQKPVVVSPTDLYIPTAEDIERSKRQAAYDEAMQLVRVIVVSLNPQKANLQGELFTFGNSYVPTMSKYVPYSDERGWHIPRILVNILREKTYQGFRTVSVDGTDRKISASLPAYTVTELPNLSAQDLIEMRTQFGSVGE